MEQGRLAVTVTAKSNGARPAETAVRVGASFAFDPGADGLAGVYAIRILDRGVDPRALCAEVRADRRGVPEHGAVTRALLSQPRAVRFGRGTAAHLQSTTRTRSGGSARLHSAPPANIESRRVSSPSWPRRLAVAGLGLLLLLPLTALIP